MVTPRYKVRFRIVNLSSAQTGAVVPFPVDAWRATFLLAGTTGNTTLDQVDFGAVADPGASGGGPATFTVGGVFMPDGSPAVLDQRVFRDTVAAKFFGVMVLEYLEPLNS